MAGLVAGLAAPALAQDERGDEPGDEPETVRLARATWDTGWFQTEVYRILLQRLGYRVDGPVTMENEEFYEAVADGDVDLWVNGWFPLHDALLGDGAEAVGTQVEQGALQGYFVDLPTAEAHDITDLGDLADPEIAELFDLDGDGRADLIGCNPAWECAVTVDHHLDVYDLDEHVEQVQGDYSPLMADTVQRYRAGEPVLFYTFTPNWTVGELVPGQDVRWLETPFPSLPPGQADAVDRTEVAGVPGCASEPCQTGWPPNDIRAVANREFLSGNPSVRALLEQVEIPLDDIHEQNARMVDGDGDLADIRRHAEEWVAENGDDVEQWITAADPEAEPVAENGTTGLDSADALRVVARPLEPFVSYEGQGYTGFSVELMELVAARLGADVEVYAVNTVAKQLDDVARGEADAALAAINITAERERQADFTVPVVHTGLTILVPSEADRGVLDRAAAFTKTLLASDLPWLLLLFGVVLLLSAHLIWWVERRPNPDLQVPYKKGIWDSLWWTSVAITPFPAGDRTPKGNPGRVVALLWMFAGYFVLASLLASITSTLAVAEIRGAITGPSDLRGNQVATVSGSSGEDYLRSEGISPVTFADIDDAYAALGEGDVDAIVFDAPVLRYHAAHEGRGEVTTVGPVFEEVRYGIAVGLDDHDLRKDVNLALLELMESGLYDQVHDRWFGGLD